MLPFRIAGDKALCGEVADNVPDVFVASVQKTIGLGDIRHDGGDVPDDLIQNLRLGKDPSAIFKHVEGNAVCNQIQGKIVESGSHIDMFKRRDPVRHTVPVRVFRLLQDGIRVIGDRPVGKEQDFVEKRLQLPVVLIFLRREIRQQQDAVLPCVDSLPVDDRLQDLIHRCAMV